MGAKQSNEMKRALKLVRDGLTAYAAAAKVGITRGALYKNATYRAIMAERAAKK